MDILFFTTKVLTQLILPPTSLLLLALIALLLLKRWPRSARIALWASLVSLLLLSTPRVSSALNATLKVPAMDKQTAASAQAIMILGGGLKRNTAEYGDTPSTYSLERIRYGAKLARDYRLPVLVTGGQVYGGRPEAELMAETLNREFGVHVRWVENRSRDTHENLRFSAAVFKGEHIQRVILVTHDNHMRRALAECQLTYLQCYAAPVSSFGSRDSWIEELPNAGALRSSALSIHELLGNLAMIFR